MAASLRLTVKIIDNQLIIEVIDTGTGIEDEDIANLYNPFVTSKKNRRWPWSDNGAADRYEPLRRDKGFKQKK